MRVVNVRIVKATPTVAKGPRLEIALFLALDEDERSEAVQAEMRNVEARLADGGNKVMPRIHMRKAMGAESWLTGEFIVHLVSAVGLSGILSAWISAKLGRKVRLKVGDIEAEASNAKELNELLDRAREIKEQTEASADKPGKPVAD
jgi:hypothetical protein